MGCSASKVDAHDADEIDAKSRDFNATAAAEEEKAPEEVVVPAKRRSSLGNRQNEGASLPRPRHYVCMANTESLLVPISRSDAARSDGGAFLLVVVAYSVLGTLA